MTKTNEELRTIESDVYGTLEVRSEQIFRFKKGLVGLEQQREFALLPIDQSDYFMLHSTVEALSFFLVPADKVVRDYEFELSAETIDLLEVQKPEDVAVFLIVNLAEDQVSVNLKAPVLLSVSGRQGIQIIINEKDYPIRLPIMRKETG
jgi:flagellar assembly factor FliW